MSSSTLGGVRLQRVAPSVPARTTQADLSPVRDALRSIVKDLQAKLAAKVARGDSAESLEPVRSELRAQLASLSALSPTAVKPVTKRLPSAGRIAIGVNASAIALRN